MPRILLTFAIVLAGLVSTPSFGAAQGESRTHTVKRGDTLWDLAQQYLGDPFRWPEIYRRNTETVSDPNLIYPDQVLIISGEVQATPGTPPDQPPTTPGDSSMVVQPGDTMMSPTEPALPPPAMTIFNPDRYRVVRGRRERLSVRPRGGAVRSGDYIQAPFLWEASGVAGAGTINAMTTQAVGPGLTPKDRPIPIYERVYVRIPQDAQGFPDERFLIFRYGPDIKGRGRVVIPTGVVKLASASVNGQAQAILLAKYEEVFSGQHAMPIDTLTAAQGVFPTHVEFGLLTTVAYVHDNPVLLPVGQALIFLAGSADGLVPGDQLTLVKSMGFDDRGAPRAPEEIAVAQVTRVTPWGASAIIIDQSGIGVAKGSAARVTAKMP